MEPIDILLKTKFDKDGLVAHLCRYPDQIEAAIQLMLGAKQPQGWRATWILKSILKDNDPRLGGRIDELLAGLPIRPDGHQRELLHILLGYDLDDEQEGLVFETCLSLWTNIRKSPSVRYLALRHLAVLVKKYPELAQELELVSDSAYMESLSPGIRNACKRMITELLRRIKK